MKKNYIEMTDEELQSALHELQEEGFSLRFQRKTQEIANPLRVRIIRREIARIKTVIGDRERTKGSKIG
jgi:large subunit ribosomal protein L29